MEDDASMSKLVELIFGKKATILEKTVEHSSIPSSWMTEAFSDKLTVVLRLRKFIISRRYLNFLLHEYCKTLSSPKMYLECVITACCCEHECNRNIFDTFISVCALVIHFSEETLEKTGVDFRPLNPDIVMVFNRNVLKSYFVAKRGFYPFVDYISGHKYLKWNCDRNDHILSDDSDASVSLLPDEKIDEELNRYRSFQDVTHDRESALEAIATSMVNEVLSNTSVELPTFPSEPDLVARSVASREKETTEKADRSKRAETASTCGPSSKSDVITNYLVDQQRDIARHENIIQAVIRHNHSKNLAPENTNSQIHANSDGTLKNLKNRINSLIEVLDECENE